MPDETIMEKIGMLSGRVSATESRLDRHESFVGQQITSMNSKLDKLGEQLASSAGRLGLMSLVWSGGGGAAIGFLIFRVLGVH